MRFHGASGRFCTLLTPMSRNTGTPSDSMNRSYGVFGRPNFPKPARLPAEGSCQWLLGTSCMGLLLRLGRSVCCTPFIRHRRACPGDLDQDGTPVRHDRDRVWHFARPGDDDSKSFLRQLALVALLVELRI